MKIVHIIAGADDWTPSMEELQQLVALFQEAEHDPLETVIASRDGIKAEVIEVPDDSPLLVLANPSSIREQIAHRLLSEFLVDSPSHQHLPAGASTELVKGYHMCLSNFKARLEQLVSEAVPKP